MIGQRSANFRVCSGGRKASLAEWGHARADLFDCATSMRTSLPALNLGVPHSTFLLCTPGMIADQGRRRVTDRLRFIEQAVKPAAAFVQRPGNRTASLD